MTFELWDTESANIIDDFPTRESALEAVRQAMRASGPTVIDHLALAYEDREGETHPIAAGSALAELAHTPNPAHAGPRVQ
jgi:hypothetical protein